MTIVVIILAVAGILVYFKKINNSNNIYYVSIHDNLTNKIGACL